MAKLTLKSGKGINRDQLASELEPGVWSDCQNMRFHIGRDERVGGIALATTPSVAPYAMEAFDVATASGVTRYTVEIGLAKAYAWDGTTRTEITRGLNGAATTLAGTGVTVTVTSNAHGLTTGDKVVVAGVIPTGYNTAVGGVAITVVDANNFSYANTTSAAVTQGGYWDSNRTSDFTAAAGEEITTAVLNGVLYVNTMTDGCYYWGGVLTAADPRARLRRLRTFDGTNYNHHIFGRSIAAYRDYLFVFGYLGAGISLATPTSITRKPFDIAWGAAAAPGTIPATFFPLSTNDAGSVQKTRGAVVHGRTYGGTLYVYQDRGINAVNWTGGNSVFSFTQLDGSDGLLAPNNIVNTPAGQFFFSQNMDLKVHTGGAASSVAEGVMLNWIRDNTNSTYYARSFLLPHHYRDEVWLCIPTSVATASKALLYNYKEQTWGERDLSLATCGVAGMLPTTVATTERLLIATTDPKVGLADSGTTDLGSTFTSMVERKGMGDGENYQTLHASNPHLDATAALTASVFHGSSATPDGTVTYTSAITYTQGTTQRCNGFANSGRYLAWKMTTTAAEAIANRTVDLWFNVDGTD